MVCISESFLTWKFLDDFTPDLLIFYMKLEINFKALELKNCLMKLCRTMWQTLGPLYSNFLEK